ncbi:MAG: tetratricopeptide repeat protein [Candidatus Acidiferrum sp.]
MLVAWLPVARAQTHKSTSPVDEQKATVSVRELQVPAKAQGAFVRGVEELAKGDATGSLRHFRRAIQEFPGFYEAYYNEGVAETQLQQTDEALQSFQSAINLSGGRCARAYFGYSLVLARLGRSKEAESIVRRGMEEDPSLSDGYAVLSTVLFNQNRLDDAEEAAHKALRLPNPSARSAFLTLADVHLRKGDYRSAAKDMESYLRAVGSTPCKDDAEFNQRIRKLLSEIKAKTAGQLPKGEPRVDIW